MQTQAFVHARPIFLQEQFIRLQEDFLVQWLALITMSLHGAGSFVISKGCRAPFVRIQPPQVLALCRNKYRTHKDLVIGSIYVQEKAVRCLRQAFIFLPHLIEDPVPGLRPFFQGAAPCPALTAPCSQRRRHFLLIPGLLKFVNWTIWTKVIVCLVSMMYSI